LSIGFRFEALSAGFYPKKLPSAEEKANDITIDVLVITTG
jgi:hypothetical protein